MAKIVVIAPHPDDETLGCGGTLLKLKEKGNAIFWIIGTEMKIQQGFSEEKIQKRNTEIQEVSTRYKMSKIFPLRFPATEVDTLPVNCLVEAISSVFNEIQPEVVFLPFINDSHTDHYFLGKAALSCCKWFRHAYIKQVVFYETISETDENFDTSYVKFMPNVFVDISKYIDQKIDIMRSYYSEMGVFPFPRSEKAIRSLAYVRGSQCGVDSAEAFQLVKGVF